MKKEMFVICIVGMFLASGLLGATSGKTMNDDHEVNDLYQANEGSLTYIENKVYVGKTWTVNEADTLTGTANLEIENMSVNWIVEPQADGSFGEEARGMVNMDIFKFNFEDENNGGNICPAPLIDRYSNYQITVYDGESTDDTELLQDSVPFVGGGMEFTNLSSLLTVDTNNKPSRTLAFRATAETQTYSPVLRFSFEGAAGLRSKVGHMIINFITPSEAAYMDEPKIDSPGQLEASEEVKFEVGELEIKTPWPNPNVPKANIKLNPDKEIRINKSEEVHVNAWLNWTIDLTEKAYPPRLPFWSCEARFSLRAICTDKLGEEYPRDIDSKRIHLIGNQYKNNGTINLDFTIDTDEYPTNVMFLVTYFLTISSTMFNVDHDNAGNSDFNYIFWKYS